MIISLRNIRIKTVFKKCVPCCGFSGVECTVHICWIISRTVQGWKQWYCAFRIVSASFLILRILKVYLLQHIINCFSAQLLPVAMYGITRPNFMNNNVDILTLFLIAWDIIMCNKSLFTKIIYIHCLISTLQLLVPHMVLILNICYDHSILIRKFAKMHASCQYHISSWSRCGNWVWYWPSARLTDKPRRVWTSATHKRRTQYCRASREHGPVDEELMRRPIPVSTYDGFDVLLYNLKVCHNKIVCL